MLYEIWRIQCLTAEVEKYCVLLGDFRRYRGIIHHNELIDREREIWELLQMYHQKGVQTPRFQQKNTLKKIKTYFVQCIFDISVHVKIRSKDMSGGFIVCKLIRSINM